MTENVCEYGSRWTALVATELRAVAQEDSSRGRWRQRRPQHWWSNNTLHDDAPRHEHCRDSQWWQGHRSSRYPMFIGAQLAVDIIVRFALALWDGNSQGRPGSTESCAPEPSVAWLLSLKKREENGTRKLSACGGCQNVPQERISERFRHRH